MSTTGDPSGEKEKMDATPTYHVLMLAKCVFR